MKSMRLMVLSVAWACLLPLSFYGCSGGGDDLVCMPDSCSSHGECNDSSGEIVCSCEQGYTGAHCGACAEGYQDNDGDGSCLESCSDDYCSGHGTCSDAQGTASCECEDGYSGEKCTDCADGYQDNDEDGTCLQSCASLSWDCANHGSCVDDSGVAMCQCDSGYQDNDADGTCTEDCTTADLECGDHGSCDDSAGQAQCACEEAWGGDTCDVCADGYQDNDADGTCEIACGVGVLDCGEHGYCVDSSGHVECKCVTGHTGDDCSECADGYQDNDGDGACQPGCDLFGGSCGTHGHCDDSTGETMCVCDEGHIGDDCATCDDGYQDNNSDGYCLPTCETSSLNCGQHGDCSDSSGFATCDCQEGYAGDLCDLCSGGYQDNDGDGVCTVDCFHADLSCGNNAMCDDSEGTAVCVCNEGYAGDNCDTCADGYQDNDDNQTCMPTCGQLGWDCSNHGSCDDSGGIALCQCDEQYTGSQCDQCAAGYQDNDGDGVCSVACSAASLNCGANSHCDDSTGTAGCVCDDGYVGANCDQCADGYQDTDMNGSCMPTCESLAWDCSGHGTCTYESGEAVCACEEGYFDDGVGHCIVVGAGENCMAPLPLDLSQTLVSGDTTGMGNDNEGSCASSSHSADDVVYVFSVVQPLHVVFEVTGFDTIMYIRSTCDDAASEIECNDDGGEGLGSLLDLNLSVGTYYLFIDGYSSGSGQYDLSIQVSCGDGLIYDPQSGDCIDDPCLPNPCNEQNMHVCEPVLPASFTCSCDPGYIDDPQNPGTCIPDPNPHGEACADAMPLTVGEGTLTGTTSDANDDARGSCGGNGPDRVYGFVIDEPMRAEFEMSGYDTVLHLRTTCDDPDSQIACDDEGGSAHGSKITEMLDPGTYYLWADSWSSGGDYDLTYSFRTDPCNPDPCPGTPECVASFDWTSYECVCPEGTLPFDGDCVDDPCDPNECVEEHKNKCIPELPGAYHCECNTGYIPDPAAPDTCIMDPDANEWAFIVYLNADNNLESYGYEDVSEMGQAGSSPYVHIVALFDTYAGPANVIYITQGGYDVVEERGEIDMSDWQTLRDFGIWAIDNYPARHYAMIMWDHGGGWKKPVDSPVTKGFSNDDHGTAYEISVSNGDYAQALAGITDHLGDKLDIVGFDACLMGMWEVADASAPYAHYLVASSETEPGRGWAYHGFLPGLVANWQMSALELATSIVDAFYNEDAGDSTLAVTDLDTMDDLNAAITNFANVLMAHPDLYGSISSVRGSTQSFYLEEFRDLQDFAERVAAMNGAPSDLVDAANALVAQLQITIAYNRAQSDYPGANGLSVYFPQRGTSPDSEYTGAGAVWSLHTTWDEFLESF